MTYRTIDLTGLVAVEGAEPGIAPQMQWLALSDLVIDDRYQRPLLPNSMAAIQKIAREFSWAQFSPVLVAPVEGGRWAIIDGQHRAHAAALCGFAQVPAMIVMVEPTAQAQAFVRINTSHTPVRAEALYRAALAAGEAWALRARRAVEAGGCRLMTFNATTKSKKPFEVYATTLIRQMIEAGHDAAVTSGLRALVDLDPASVANFSNTLLAPWLGAVAQVKGGHKADLLGVLRKNRPWQVLERAERWAAESRVPAGKAKRTAFAALISDQVRGAA